MRTAMRNQYSEYRIQNTFKKLSSRYFTFFTNKNGFTLIETIIVMVIIGILAVVVAARNPFDSIKLRSAARKVAEDIRYVQKLAVSNQTRAGITFNVNGYSVYSDIVALTPAPSPGDPCSTGVSNNLVVDFTQSRCSNYQNVRITALPGTNPIAFNSLGSPVDNTGAAIGNQSLTITYGGTAQVSVSAETGRVSY